MDGSGNYTNYNSNLHVADGNWHFVAVTVDRDDPNGLVFYVDGNQKTMDPTARQGSLDNDHDLLIAGNCLTNHFFTSGSIDEVELFNRVLPPEVIYSIIDAYQRGSNIKCKQTDCMISYWQFEDLGANWADDSHDGNHGNLQDAWFVDTPGVAGSAYMPELDIGFIGVPDSPNLNFSTGSFALEAWINYEGSTDGSGEYPAIMSKRPGPDGSNPNGGFFLGLSYWSGANPGSLILRMDNTNYVPNTVSIDDGHWHHVVVQRCDNDEVQFWVDGHLDATVTSTKDISSSADLRFGLDSSSSYETHWEGMLDEIAVYNCCLLGAEIQEHHQNGLNGEHYSY